MMRNILQLDVSSEILRKNARELTIEEIKSSRIQGLIHEMKETMRNAPGVGLAAPQIGESIQLAVIEDPAERLKEIDPLVLKDRGREPVDFHVIINPKIIKLTGKTNYFFEGCLSVKSRVRVTGRNESIQVNCLDETGTEKTIEASGWYARILQHEIDHLHGVLYVDKADSRTELEINDDYLNKWVNAKNSDICRFYNEKCPDKKIDETNQLKADTNSSSI